MRGADLAGCWDCRIVLGLGLGEGVERDLVEATLALCDILEAEGLESWARAFT
ncbi:hypothetical protein [Mesorhizobium sp. M7A.F.Ca.US.011.01.1.1]|uniref:hypothetical protein n=1 Tax=Mesorhizobium sp. M7A.F.Ca.US.011.01.1.1 TaxID=2496741 RepID=UPI0013E36C61|nr:hypothetical protein [Mesorhizobium sp. M7A.F.Ca.US.011.01.1.1]